MNIDSGLISSFFLAIDMDAAMQTSLEFMLVSVAVSNGFVNKFVSSPK